MSIVLLGESNAIFSSGWALPLRPWFGAGCRIVDLPKMMPGAELPNATVGFS